MTTLPSSTSTSQRPTPPRLAEANDVPATAPRPDDEERLTTARPAGELLIDVSVPLDRRLAIWHRMLRATGSGRDGTASPAAATAGGALPAAGRARPDPRDPDREHVALLGAIGTSCGDATYDRFANETVARHPEPARLRATLRGIPRRPGAGVLRRWRRMTGRDPVRSYDELAVARDLLRLLDEAGRTCEEGPPGGVAVGPHLWRVETADGPVLVKGYASRRGRRRELLRRAAGALLGSKTSADPAARARTEHAQLLHWAAAGFDVPVPRSDYPLAAGRDDRLVMSFVDGEPLSARLAPRRGLGQADRHALLSRYGRAWGRRHAAAVELDDARLLQEHASLAHVLVCGERFVTIDHDQAWRRGHPVRRALAKEVASTVRSLCRLGDDERVAGNLRALVDGHERPDLLRAAVDEYLRCPSPWRRALWWIDRRWERGHRRSGKYAALETLDRVLAQRA